jgi:hypothetical protein
MVSPPYIPGSDSKLLAVSVAWHSPCRYALSKTFLMQTTPPLLLPKLSHFIECHRAISQKVKPAQFTMNIPAIPKSTQQCIQPTPHDTNQLAGLLGSNISFKSQSSWKHSLRFLTNALRFQVCNVSRTPQHEYSIEPPLFGCCIQIAINPPMATPTFEL